MRHRRQRAGAAHLHFDALHRGDGLARGVFVGDGPARRLGGVAQLLLLRHGIHLHHHAVDLVRQFVALRLPFGAERQHLLDVAAQLAVRIHLEAHARQLFERLPMAVEGRPALGQQEISVVIEAPRGGDLRLQHAQRAGGGVARIGEAREAALLALGVEPLEGAAGS